MIDKSRVEAALVWIDAVRAEFVKVLVALEELDDLVSNPPLSEKEDPQEDWSLWRVASRSGGFDHEVTADEDGRAVSCSCEASRNGRICWVARNLYFEKDDWSTQVWNEKDKRFVTARRVA